MSPSSRSSRDELRILTLCTGNAVRSVMLAYMLGFLADAAGQSWSLKSAGTHAVEGQAISPRTRDALRKLEPLESLNVTTHRSHQLVATDVDWADLVVCAETANVLFVRATVSNASAKTVLLGQFVRDAQREVDVPAMISSVASEEPDPRCDVADPAGGDQAAYDECARQLWLLAQAFAQRLDAAT